MPTLRLTQSTAGPDQYRIELALESDRVPRKTATTTVEFSFTAQTREQMRWYFEDFLQQPAEPAPTIAARIEQRMQELGTRLFQAVFMANNDTRRIWDRILDELDTLRIEIAADVAGATALPWELLFDPDTHGYLALQTETFVHTHAGAVRTPRTPSAEGPIRILLVICRPGGRDDVPFRSVAMRLIKGLREETAQAFQLDLLRPPTFERLGDVLRRAKAEGQPYHVLHFDGHGAFLDMAQLFDTWTESEMMERLAELVNIDRHRFSPQVLYPRPQRAGSRGYLAFENPDSHYNLRLVDGPELGSLLVETGVPALVLNACRSAHAEPETPPDPSPDSPPLSETGPGEGSDLHSQVRAIGSLAQEVMDAGVAGVVAMRYNVYVVTAAQFVADLYSGLSRGHQLGVAGSLGRKQLHAQPLRSIGFDPRPLQDWPVPVIYEATPLSIFPKPAAEPALQFDLAAGEAAARSGALDPGLPPPPDVGFFGRDETLLALDRAFDSQPIVLLHAYAGSGKTTAAAEFARWYALTGGVAGPVLFTTFEQYRPLARVLDQIEQIFGPALEQAGVQWLTLTDEQRTGVALQVLQQIPVLWIWDNVEPVAGFPAGAASAWSDEEQQELADFLRAARETKARFLLTSRRDERPWLGDLPARISLPPMPFQERVQLAQGIAAKHGRNLAEVEDWRPLLQFSRGNPLTITVLVGQALRDGLKSKDQIEAFVAQLRAGEAHFEDEAAQGRTKSLGASLSYGFEHGFTEAERKQLALLHFFQGFVDVDVLVWMGDPEDDWSLPELHGLSRDHFITLLDRAAEIGLLTAHGDGYYSIHPALPWYFKTLFDHYYPAPTIDDDPNKNPKSEIKNLKSTRTFVEAMGVLGDYYHDQYEAGNRDVIAALSAEESNLLHARQLALRQARQPVLSSAEHVSKGEADWHGAIISTMQGLQTLYDHTGRRAEWRRLVEVIVSDFVDPASDGPLPGREEWWHFVAQYRTRLVIELRQWTEAERMQQAQVQWFRQRAAPALALLSNHKLDGDQVNAIQTLAVSLEMLAIILREQGSAECVVPFEEAINLCQKTGDRTNEAIGSFNLGRAYEEIPALRDLAQAERWYQRCLELLAESDRLGRSKCISHIGIVKAMRFREAKDSGASDEETLQYGNEAIQAFQLAIDWTPSDAINDLASEHEHLGNIYGETGHLNHALHHWREAIRYAESASKVYTAAQTRSNVALALANAGRLADARAYALAALRNYETFGERAAAEIERTRGLVAQIERMMNGER